MTKDFEDEDDDLDFTPEEIEQLTKIPMPPKNLEELMNSEDAFEFVEKLMLQINCQGDEAYKKLPPLSKLATAINAFNLETGSGGIGQFLLNSDSPLINDCREYLRAIGASKAMKILEQALALFPNGNIPGNKKELGQLMMSFEKRGPNDPFRPLERAMYQNDENLPELLQKYVIEHKQELSKETGLV